MRLSLMPFVLALPLCLGCCGVAVPVFHRTVFDMGVSAVSRRDCSVVNLDRGERYCRPREPAPQTPVFCTRSLGVADCWVDGSELPNNSTEIADGPRTLTREQERARTRAGLGLW